ncbi:MAG: hypothetical protein DMG65_19650 [Candidatus Angelobacter sp. Gp1-AA117]|nr:MAG: hypothetical protein DMG65_19650 [Candidatus Angelobacter sp. Gp1-AA117]
MLQALFRDGLTSIPATDGWQVRPGIRPEAFRITATTTEHGLSAATLTDNSGNITNQVPYPVYVVTAIGTNDGSGTASTSTYQYSGGTYFYSTPTDHKFAGFKIVTETDAAGNVTKTYYHTGNGTDSAHGEYADNFWKIGKPYRVEQYDNAGNLYKLTVSKWDSASLGGNAAFVKLVQKTELDYDGLSTHKDSAETYAYDNTTGNQIQKVQLGQVMASSDGSFTDTGSDDITTSTSYASSTTSGVISKPADVTITNHSGTKIRETQYFYDALGLGNVGAGNLTKEQDWKSGSTYITAVQNMYNGYGLITQQLDPRNNTTTYTYDTCNLYIATTTNPLSQSTAYQYDYSTGKTTQTTDPNGNQFQAVYDGLGRTLASIAPDPANPGSLATTTAYVYTDTPNGVSVYKIDYLTATTSIDTYTYYDGLNRLIQTRKSAEDAGNYKVTDRAYNSLGLLQKESFPYFASGSSKTTPTTTTALFTTYTYDPLRRILTIANAVGTTTNAYSNWKIATTDPRGKEKDIYNDAYGNLVQVDEHSGTSTYSTYYSFDGSRDLLSITDALGNVRSFTYDGLGRRLTAQDLHASSASTFGSWTYVYDDAGNLTMQTDPNGINSSSTYDKLNRILTDKSPLSGSTSYLYDSGTKGKGHIFVGITSGGGSTRYAAYNGLGLVTQEVTSIASINYTTNYTYDRQGNLLTITNPDNSVVQYTYNLAGLPETVSYQPSGGSLAMVISNFDYSPTEQPAVIAYANGVTTTNTYDAAHLYRLSQKTSTLPGSGNAQNISYTYDADGNITQIADTSISGAARTVAYAYDDFSRLTMASSTNASTTNYLQNFSYDPLGNMLSGPAGTYSYGPTASSTYANPDALTGITVGSTTRPFNYDNNGNLISSGTSTYAWDYRNELTQSVTANGTSTYGYGYDRRRLKLIENGVTTTFPSIYYNVTTNGSSTTTIKHVFVNSIPVVTVTDATAPTSTALRYVLNDHLNGTNIMTDASGTIVETLDYYPYGQTRLDTKVGSYTGENRKFIGQESDSVSGLDYLNARYYDGGRDQFVSEDPSFLAIGDPNQVRQDTNQEQQAYLADPQQLNSYSYGRDNPITESDPKGRQASAAISLGIPELSLSGIALPITAVVGLITVAIPAAQWGLGGADALMNQTTQAIYYDQQRQMRFIPQPQIKLPEAPSLFPIPGGEEPPKLPDSKWLRWSIAGSLIIGGAADIYQNFQEEKQAAQEFNESQANTAKTKANGINKPYSSSATSERTTPQSDTQISAPDTHSTNKQKIYP